MGKLVYGPGGYALEVGDRVLAHLQVGIFTKLRRGERFMLTVHHGGDEEHRFVSISFDAAIPVRFAIAASARHDVNEDWLRALAQTASTPNGLRIDPEAPTSAEDALLDAGSADDLKQRVPF